MLILNFKPIFAQDGISYKGFANPQSFSPDNQFLAVEISGDSIDIWDLKSVQSLGKFRGTNPNFFNHNFQDGSWAQDASYYLTWLTIENQSKRKFSLIKLSNKQQYEIDDQNGSIQIWGSYDATNLWGFDKNSNSLSTYLMTFDEAKKSIQLQKNWSISLNGKIKDVYFSPTSLLFFILENVEKGPPTITNTLKKGDLVVTPLPKKLQKDLKGKFVLFSRKNYLLFKKDESYAVFNLGAFTVTPVFTEHKIISDRQYFTDKMMWNNPVDFENFFFRGQVLPSGSWIDVNKDFGRLSSAVAFNEDLSMVALVKSCGNNELLISVYNTLNLFQAPINLVDPKYKELEDFKTFIKSHKPEYEKMVSEIDARLTTIGWEKVKMDIDMSKEVSDGYFEFNTNYNYCIVRTGYDQLANELKYPIPASTELNYLLQIKPNSTGRTIFDNIQMKYVLGEADIIDLTSKTWTTIFVSFTQLGHGYASKLPAETFDIFIYRIPKRLYSGEPIDLDKNSIELPPTVSSSSSSDPCKSAISEDIALADLRKLEATFSSISKLTTLASTVSNGTTVQSFYMPEKSVHIMFFVITSSPCNKLKLYHTNNNSYAELRYEGTPEMKELAGNTFVEALKSKGYYFYQFTAPYQDVTNLSDHYTLYVTSKKENQEAYGTSMIFIGY
jgi:hypothetical protein